MENKRKKKRSFSSRFSVCVIDSMNNSHTQYNRCGLFFLLDRLNVVCEYVVFRCYANICNNGRSIYIRSRAVVCVCACVRVFSVRWTSVENECNTYTECHFCVPKFQYTIDERTTTAAFSMSCSRRPGIYSVHAMIFLALCVSYTDISIAVV